MYQHLHVSLPPGTSCPQCSKICRSRIGLLRQLRTQDIPLEHVLFRRCSVENPIINCSGSLLSDVPTTLGGTTDKAYVFWMTDFDCNVEIKNVRLNVFGVHSCRMVQEHDRHPTSILATGRRRRSRRKVL